MAFQTKLAELEAALIGRLQAKLQDVKDIAPLSSSDFNEADQIVTQSPAVRLFFRDEQLDHRTDLTATTYQSLQRWVVLAGGQNLRSKDDQRSEAFTIADRVCDALAGHRPALPSQQQGPLVVLKSTSLFQSGPSGTWYAIEIEVESITQFGGS